MPVDGEAVSDDGEPDFHAPRSKRRGRDAVLFAFDLLERRPARSAADRAQPATDRQAQSRAIRFNEHLTGGGPTIFKHVCQMGAGRDRVEADGGLSKTWLKSKELGERGGAPGARGGWR